MTYRLGVDVGGTFTDVLLIDTDTGGTWRVKTASTPADQSIGVLHGIRRVCDDAGIAMADIGEVLHGTTVATNAILEQKGARVGLVTTKGFEQVLQIARSFVPGGLAGWIIWPKPEPLASLEHTVGAVERVASDGTVVTRLDEEAIRADLHRLKDAGIDWRDVQFVAGGETVRALVHLPPGAAYRAVDDHAAKHTIGQRLRLLAAASGPDLPEARELAQKIAELASPDPGLRADATCVLALPEDRELPREVLVERLRDAMADAVRFVARS